MREGLEQDLRKYNEVAKRELEFNSAEHTRRERGEFRREAEASIEALFHETVNNSVVGKEPSLKAAQKVYQLQLEKQRIMQQLRTDIAHLDGEEHWETSDPSALPVRQDDEGLYIAGFEDRETPVTLGEIISSENWGLHFSLDPSSCDRATVKKWLVERAKNQLRERMNRQIQQDAFLRGQKNDVKNYGMIVGNDKLSSNAVKSKKEIDSQLLGVITEKFVRNYLVKTSIDTDLDFEVIDTDAEMDVYQKVDLIVSRRTHKRDVQLQETDSEAPALGLQITISQNKGLLRKKQAALEKVQAKGLHREFISDVALVQISPSVVAKIRNSFNTWRSHPTPKGPDHFIPLKIKEKLFKELLSGMFTQEELDDQWRKAMGSVDKEKSKNIIAENIESERAEAAEGYQPILPEIIQHEQTEEAAD